MHVNFRGTSRRACKNHRKFLETAHCLVPYYYYYYYYYYLTARAMDDYTCAYCKSHRVRSDPNFWPINAIHLGEYIRNECGIDDMIQRPQRDIFFLSQRKCQI